MSGLEYDMHRYNRTSEEMTEVYQARNVDASRILDSHARQKENLQKVLEIFPDADVLTRAQLSRERTQDADLVVSLGGDNHLTYVAHFVDAPILGLNSDPQTSEGVLLYFDCEGLERVVDRLRKDDYEIEEWPRIRVVLDGKPIEPGITEYYLGEQEVLFTSYNVLSIAGESTVHRGSGTLVSNGVGSTGWYLTASRYVGGESFPRTARKLRVLAREPFFGRYNRIVQAEIGEGEAVTVVSNNDTHGIVVADSLVEFQTDFPPGAEVELSVDDATTRIIRSGP